VNGQAVYGEKKKKQGGGRTSKRAEAIARAQNDRKINQKKMFTEKPETARQEKKNLAQRGWKRRIQKEKKGTPGKPQQFDHGKVQGARRPKTRYW